MAYAHSRPGVPVEQWHILDEHLAKVGDLAARFAESFGSAEWARIAGEWHDLGKYAPDFQRKLAGESGAEAHIETRSHTVDHSSAGAVHAIGALGPPGMFLSWVIAGHHGGLLDKEDLRKRLKDKAGLLEKVKSSGCPAALLARSAPDLPGFLGEVDARRCEFWIRLLFSAVADADFLDTEEWFGGVTAKAAARVRAREALFPTIADLNARLNGHLQSLMQGKSGKVNALRARVLSACRRAGDDPNLLPGHFSLTVPTGGGKTLSSLSFGFRHALRHDLRRVIVVIPYTSIIEQTADAFREALASEAGDLAVVEHHSAIDPDDPCRENLRTRVAYENWDAPVIVTTSVQFFESLFSNRPGSCRKLHNIAKSVIVMDEVQTFPTSLLLPIVDGLRELVRGYGCSTVLCTATQPALDRWLDQVREIVPPIERDSNFDLSRERVQVEWPRSDGASSWEEIARLLEDQPQALAIVHLRDDARDLVQALDRIAASPKAIHLSALMYPAHRRALLDEIKRILKDGKPCRVVSTQLVEAGVNVDFPVVYRALAGADALAQAAGRCNREGMSATGCFRVFLAPTTPPGVLRQGLQIMRAMLAENPAQDLFDPALYRDYFRRLYGIRNLDPEGIQADRAALNFKSVADKFRLIPEGTTSIVIPVDAPLVSAEPCRRVLEKIRRDGVDRDCIRRLQRYTVAVYPKMLDLLEANAALECLPTREECAVRVLRDESLYDERFGLLGPVSIGALIA